MADFRELRLTSPHMNDKRLEGTPVRHAQDSLNHNRFGTFYKGKLDGIYGDETAGATKEAKYKLGYMKRLIDFHYDERLDNHLNNKGDISPMMKRRRKQRTQQATQDAGNKVRAADLLAKEAGYHEQPPGSNCSKFGDWYGLRCAPWCAMSVSWAEAHAGNDWFRYSYCPAIYSAALHGVHGMRFTTSPEKGDLCLMHYPGGEYPTSHVGIVLDGHPWRWVSGNSSDGVNISTSNREDVVKFVRLPS
jgi:hypothetical protein